MTNRNLSRVLHRSVVLVALLAATACGASQPAVEPTGHEGMPGMNHEGMPGMEGHENMPGMEGHQGMPGMADGDAAHHLANLWAVQRQQGVVLTDGSGHLLYRYDGDTTNPPTSTCTGPCAQTWLPALIEDPNRPLELMGVKADLIGNFQRPDGTYQLTIAGWPIYYNTTDDGTGATADQNGAEGKWFIVNPKGEKVSPA